MSTAFVVTCACAYTSRMSLDKVHLLLTIYSRKYASEEDLKNINFLILLTFLWYKGYSTQPLKLRKNKSNTFPL